MIKRFLAASLSVAGLFLACLVNTIAINPANASDGVVLSINPAGQELEFDPGQHYTSSVTVYNVGKVAFDFEVSISPYQIKNDKYDPDFITENAYTKLANWITFPQKYFHLDPGHAAVVNFDVDVPEDAIGGGQYAAIIVRTTRRSPEDDAAEETPSEGMQIVSQLASILYAHVQGGAMRLDGSMTKHHFPSLMLGSEFKISTVFENRGNIDYRVTESWQIRDFFTGVEVVAPASLGSDGQLIGTTSATVLPGTKRTIDMIWRQAPQIGLFRVSQTISFLDDMQTYEKVVFVCPLWLTILVTIFVVLIILWIIAIIARHRRDQPQVF